MCPSPQNESFHQAMESDVNSSAGEPSRFLRPVVRRDEDVTTADAVLAVLTPKMIRARHSRVRKWLTWHSPTLRFTPADPRSSPPRQSASARSCPPAGGRNHLRGDVHCSRRTYRRGPASRTTMRSSDPLPATSSGSTVASRRSMSVAPRLAHHRVPPFCRDLLPSPTTTTLYWVHDCGRTAPM